MYVARRREIIPCTKACVAVFVAYCGCVDARVSQTTGGGFAADEPTLTKAIRDAVDVAITMCENGEDASQCAVAWEVVEELSSSASRRRVDDVDADAK